MPRIPLPLRAPLMTLALAACGGETLTPLAIGPEVTQIRAAAPPGAAPGTCWGRDATPAVIETVTEQAAVPGPDGSSSYRTETSQRIVQERREVWFRTPCPPEMTAEFISSLQRALAARGLYRGAITGTIDGPTRTAIRAYQKPEGLDSGTLSLAAARKLGLAVVDVPGASATPDTVPVAG
ncbi:peptidoglycan-binding domain-containing protein [Pseudooceanicola nanhaiensis]|uniref:peptidoglycan-binding domain-containing protein n=1 Tax=Pseudooceanicola nanhaiensis TaxID=375761 RepID=UPI003512FB83